MDSLLRFSSGQGLILSQIDPQCRKEAPNRIVKADENRRESAEGDSEHPFPGENGENMEQLECCG